MWWQFPCATWLHNTTPTPLRFDVSGRTALNLVGDEPGLYHNMAVLFQVILRLKPGRPHFHPVRAVLPPNV